MKNILRVLPLLFVGSSLHAANLVGLWQFENAGGPEQATVGNDLIVNGSPAAVPGVAAGDDAVAMGVGDSFSLNHGIPANGGGALVNQYTIIYDVFLPSASDGTWRSLLQTASGTGDNDGDYFLSPGGAVGVAAISYSGNSLSSGSWYRIVFSADIGASPSFRTTVISAAGTVLWTFQHANQSLDGRHALYPAGGGDIMHFFADENGEDNELHVTQLALFDGALTRAEAEALGAPNTDVAAFNAAPDIVEGTSVSLDAELNGSEVTLTLNASDGDGDTLTWSVAQAPVPGSARIISQTSAQCQVGYTPAAGYIGGDTVVIEVTDGDKSDTVTVNVTVSSPLAGDVVFYFEDFDAASLLPEQTAGAERRMPSGDGSPVWSTPAGSGLGLTSGPDSFLNDPGDRILEFTGFNLARTDFWSNGDDQGRSAAFAPGANVIAVADSDEFSDGGGTGGGGVEDEFNVFLRTPVINLPADADLSRLELRFLSSFRLEQNETSRVNVYLNGAASPTVSLAVPNSGTAPAAPVAYTLADLGNPSPGDTILIEFAHEGADNNWWWAIDEIYLGAPNQAPVITEGETLAYNVGVNIPVTVAVTVHDPDGDAINWSVSVPPAAGSVAFDTTSDTGATLTYTPPAGVIGAESFTIRAADAQEFDDITVTVTTNNTPPEITEGEAYTLNVPKDTAQDLTLHALDPDADSLNWTIAAQASGGQAVVTAQSDTQATVTFTPNAGFTGIDSFEVRVEDTEASDSIMVNVTVSDPGADPTLTIISPFGVATPGPGTYTHAPGTALTNSVSGETNGNTRHLPIGWTMLGNGPNSGSEATMSMTLTRDSVLTWLFRTEYFIDTEATPGGSVDVADGWYDSAKPLAITATPQQGYYFDGWAGDTAGAQIGGPVLVLPMNREVGVITATFREAEKFSVIGLPDTQNYSSQSSPTDVFTRQTQWILDNLVTYNIQFVSHVGDIVNSPWSGSQWDRATTALDLLDTNIAYGTAPGNHDIASGNTEYLRYFGYDGVRNDGVTPRWVDPDSGQRYDWYRGASPSGYSDFQVINVDGRDWMFLHMEIDARDQDIAWAQSVLDAHPTTLTVMSTHNYLAETGGGGAAGSGTGQRGRVPVQWIAGADRNSPEAVFQKLVYPNNQIFMVICGHNFAIYNLEETNARGNVVHEVLMDYQTLPNGGNGFLRIMEFDPAAGTIEHSTYSPYLGRYYDPNIAADHQGMFDLHDVNGSFFTIDVDFDTRFDSVLHVLSPLAAVTPGVGTHAIADGTPVVISADPVVNGGTRQIPTGWTLSGGQEDGGAGGVATIIMDGDSTLSWSWKTQYFLETFATGNGIVSVPSGWQDAGGTVDIQAQPDAGETFVQWSGDIAGAIISGDLISVPMDRPRGPVTAQFTGSTPVYTVEVVSAHPSVTPTVGTYTYEEGEEVTFTATNLVSGGTRRVPTGHTLGGSESGAGSDTSLTRVITGDLTVTWNWKTQHLLSTEVSGPGSLDADNPWIDEGAPFALTASPDANAEFDGWGGDTTGGNVAGNTFTVAAMSGPLGPVRADFGFVEHTLDVSSVFGSVTNYPPGEHPVEYGTEVTVTMENEQIGKTRHLVAGWNLTGANPDSGTGNTATFPMLGDNSLEWQWEVRHLLEVDSGLEGMVKPMDAAGWYPEGEVVELTAIPAPLFDFVQWHGDVPGDPADAVLSVTMDRPRSVAPDFQPWRTSDGTPQWWLAENTTVTGGDYESAAVADIDGDGDLAADEFEFGTTDRDSGRRIAGLFESLGGTEATLQWPSARNRVYTLRGGESLDDGFPNLLATIDGQDGRTTATITIPAGDQYFIKVDGALQPAHPASDDPDPAGLSHAPKPGSLLREMVPIPGGTFLRGEDGSGITDTAPAHEVTLQPFRMDTHEVTRADWETVVNWANQNGYDLPLKMAVIDDSHIPDPRHPVGPVLWYDAVKWCNARSEMEGLEPVYHTDTAGTVVYRTGQVDLVNANVNWSGNGYRLPTDAEWEFAARGGLTGQNNYPWGTENTLSRAITWDHLVSLNQEDDPYPLWRPVGSMNGTQPVPDGYTAEDMANGYGLYDMAGNAYEWVWDRFGPYQPLPEYDPKGPDTGATRIRRGGSWYSFENDARCSRRPGFPPGGDDNFGENGFRCVRALHPNE